MELYENKVVENRANGCVPVHHSVELEPSRYTPCRPSLAPPSMMYKDHDLAVYWHVINNSKKNGGYNFRSACNEILDYCFYKDGFIEHLKSDNRKTVRHIISLTGGGAPEKDKTIITKLSSLYANESGGENNRAKKAWYTIADISNSLMISSYSEINRFIEKHTGEDLSLTKWDIQTEHFDITSGTLKLCHKVPPRLFLILGGTLGNFNPNDVFECLNKNLTSGDLLYLSVFVHEFSEFNGTEKSVQDYAKKYTSPKLKEWVKKTAYKFMACEELAGMGQGKTIIEQAQLDPLVKKCDEQVKNSLVVHWPVKYSADGKEHTTDMVRSTRYYESNFVDFVTSKGYELCFQSCQIDGMKGFLFRKVDVTTGEVMTPSKAELI